MKSARHEIVRWLLLALLVPALVSVGCQRDSESRLGEIRALQQAGEFEASIEPTRVLLHTEPSHAEANYRLGVALVQTGRKGLAIWPLQKASQSDDYGVESGLLLAQLLLGSKDYEEAIRAADQVLALDAERRSALYIRGEANIGASRPEEALTDVGRLLENDPYDFQAQLMEEEWERPFETGRQMTVYGMFQEMATFVIYLRHEKLALEHSDKALATVYRLNARDECAHARFYEDVTRVYLEEDREGTIADLAFVAKRFRMPGVGLVPDYDQRIEVFGDKGMSWADNNTEQRTGLANTSGLHTPKPLHFFLERYTESFIREMQSFVDSIEQDHVPLVTGMDGRVPVVMAKAASMSLRERRAIALSEVSRA